MKTCHNGQDLKNQLSLLITLDDLILQIVVHVFFYIIPQANEHQKD